MLPGTLLEDRYRVLRKLGHGGEGDIYIAQDEQCRRRVAVKAQFPRTFESTETYVGNAAPLEEEFQRLTFMKDLPGIPRVLGEGHYGRSKGRYIVMELIEGVTLSSWIADHCPVPTLAAVTVVAQLCKILDSVHGIKYVHRDVCPKNIMLRPDGQVRLLDVGISGTEHEPNLELRGTPPYAPPEQYDPEALLSTQVDVFSLGVTLLAMTGPDLPYSGVEGAPDASIPPFPNGLRSKLPEELQNLALSMVAFAPEDRPNGVREVLRRLRPLLPKPGSPMPSKVTRPDPTTPYRLGLPLP